ncbi:MAG: hypothetical protein WCD11_26705 [Solirubrobacteraceae bacterium]
MSTPESFQAASRGPSTRRSSRLRLRARWLGKGASWFMRGVLRDTQAAFELANEAGFAALVLLKA